MASPFLGEIRLVGFDFAPKGWTTCQGQLLPINQNQALFALLGTMYGGNGTTTFALPNLNGEVIVGVAASYPQGSVGGSDFVTLNSQQIPAHTHSVAVSNVQAGQANPNGNHLAKAPLGLGNAYAATANVTMPPATLSNSGGNQPHENRQPHSAMRYVIALVGIFPSRD